MNYIFLRSGKAKEVFDALVKACLLEIKLEELYGKMRYMETLEPVDFSRN